VCQAGESDLGLPNSSPARIQLSHPAPSKQRRTLSMKLMFVFKYKDVEYALVYSMKGLYMICFIWHLLGLESLEELHCAGTFFF
jgi:hypothetical protein